MTARRPVIGLTLDSEPAGGYARLPWYALRQNYFSAVIAAGGLPLALPHEPELAADYLASLDGIVITGGAFDVDPALFGADERHASVRTKDRRTAFELAAARRAVSDDLPLLGICGGAQLLNVALGGSLIQHIPDEVPSPLAHEQPNPRSEPGHSVRLLPESRLAAICGRQELAVNSAHHQAVKAPGPGLAIAALAPDGVIEAIEAPGLKFCLGVQWHPEYGVSAGDGPLLAAFIAAAGERRP